MSIKTKRRIIAFLYHAGIIAITLIGLKINIPFFVGLLLFHVLTYRMIPVLRWIQEKLIKDVVCYTCGTEIDLINQFRCSCGYMPYKERHVFSPCPMCRKYFLWITCPLCETSILI